MTRIKLSLVVAALLAVLPVALRAQVLTPIPGSPFVFSSPPAGSNSNVTLLSSDESFLFVTNQGSNSVTVLNVTHDDSGNVRGLAFNSRANTTSGAQPSGMATNPTGDRLYVYEANYSANIANVLDFSISPTGSLTQIQSARINTPSAGTNSIVYVSEPGGDVVYTNNDVNPNTVTIFAVDPVLGTLTTQQSVPTGGKATSNGGFFAAPNIQSDGNFLYAVNGNVNNLGSNNISVFSIDPSSGGLAPVDGSPFAIPTGSATSGSIALSPDGTNLYAGTQQGGIVKYDVDTTSGFLTLNQVVSSGGRSAVDGLALDATGSNLIAVLPTPNQIAILNTATPMAPLPGSPYPGATANGAVVAGAVLSGLGPVQQLICGTATGNTQVTVYDFTP